MSLEKENWSPALGTLKTVLNAVIDFLNNKKQWLGSITQSSTEAPTFTVISNELGGTIVGARSSAGVYTLTLAGAFLSGKTFATIHSKNPLHAHKIVRTSDNVLTVTSYLLSVDTGTLIATETDGLLNSVYIEIITQA